MEANNLTPITKSELEKHLEAARAAEQKARDEVDNLRSSVGDEKIGKVLDHHFEAIA